MYRREDYSYTPRFWGWCYASCLHNRRKSGGAPRLVAARSSSFQFSPQAGDVRAIGRKLGVKTVLEGSVRTSGDRIRLTAQLINVEDGFHIWSEIYDRGADDILSLQQEIAGKVVESLQVLLSDDSTNVLTRESITDPKAYDYYLKGRKYFYEFRAKGFELARQMFARAIVVLDEQNKVLHTQLVPEIAEEPDYDSALAALG